MPNCYAEIDRRILGEAYGSTETMENIITLCDDYESRWPGSGDDKASCDYMAGKLEGYGIEKVHLEKFTISGWIRGPATLTVLEPKHKEIPCIALPMSAKGTVEADLIDLGDGSLDFYDKRRARLHLKGLPRATEQVPNG